MDEELQDAFENGRVWFGVERAVHCQGCFQDLAAPQLDSCGRFEHHGAQVAFPCLRKEVCRSIVRGERIIGTTESLQGSSLIANRQPLSLEILEPCKNLIRTVQGREGLLPLSHLQECHA